MPSVFGSVYGAVRDVGFPTMLVLLTAAAARGLLWPRLAGPWLGGGDGLDLKAPALLRPWRWREATEAPHLRRRCVAAGALLAFVLACSGMLSGNVDSGAREPARLTVVLYNFWGSLVLLVDAVAITDGALCCAVWWRHRRAGSAAAASAAAGSARGRTLCAAFLWLVLCWLGASSGYYWGSAADGLPAVRELQLPVAGLPGCLDGYRVGLIADVHAGPLVGRQQVTRMAAWASAAGLDVLLLDGDFADGKPELVGPIVQPLADRASTPPPPRCRRRRRPAIFALALSRVLLLRL
eukprot:SAG22_NODE_32_length_27675_cov_12.130119_13_plen_295_part_00